MEWKQHIPGEWPDVSAREEYLRLVALARKKLVGYEHFAEDAVSRAMIKWTEISPDKRGVARLEQVIKTEALSLLRSEQRAKRRDSTVHNDRSSPLGSSRPHSDAAALELRRAIAEAVKGSDIAVTKLEVEVLEHVLAGYNLADTARRINASRHSIRAARVKWKRILAETMNEPANENRAEKP